MKDFRPQQRFLAIAAAVLVMAGLVITVALGALPRSEQPAMPTITSSRPVGSAAPSATAEASATPPSASATSSPAAPDAEPPTSAGPPAASPRSPRKQPRSAAPNTLHETVEPKPRDDDADDPKDESSGGTGAGEGDHEIVVPDVRDDEHDSESDSSAGGDFREALRSAPGEPERRD